MLPDWYLARAGLGRHDLFSEFAAEYSMDLDLAEIAAESIAMTVALAHEARENPLVAEVARKASGRLPIAVVTNSETAIAGAFLDQTGLRDLFDLVLTCDDVARPKPAPDLYLLAAERFGVSPQDCLVLEDSDQGVGAARSAGMAWHDVRSAEWPPNCAGLIKSLSKR